MPAVTSTSTLRSSNSLMSAGIFPLSCGYLPAVAVGVSLFEREVFAHLITRIDQPLAQPAVACIRTRLTDPNATDPRHCRLLRTGRAAERS